MTSTASDPTNSGGKPIKPSDSHLELTERVGRTVSEMYQLLELYAPVWYTEELHEKAEAALLALGVAGNSSRPRSKLRLVEVSVDRPGS